MSDLVPPSVLNRSPHLDQGGIADRPSVEPQVLWSGLRIKSGATAAEGLTLLYIHYMYYTLGKGENGEKRPHVAHRRLVHPPRQNRRFSFCFNFWPETIIFRTVEMPLNDRMNFFLKGVSLY